MILASGNTVSNSEIESSEKYNIIRKYFYSLVKFMTSSEGKKLPPIDKIYLSKELQRIEGYIQQRK